MVGENSYRPVPDVEMTWNRTSERTFAEGTKKEHISTQRKDQEKIDHFKSKPLAGEQKLASPRHHRGIAQMEVRDQREESI
jgi:hypothetical protein